MGRVAIAFTALWFATCLYAALRGGAPERIVALLFALAAPSTRILRIAFSHGYMTVEPEVLLVDLILLAGLMAVALRSARFWPMLITSMHGIGILGHLAKALSPDILPGAYFTLVSWWSFGTQTLLGVATWRHRMRLKIHGRDPSWAWQIAAAGIGREEAGRDKSGAS